MPTAPGAKKPVVNNPFPSIPQTYVGDNAPDVAGKGLADIRKPSVKPFSGLGASSVRMKLDARRKQTANQPSVAGETV